MNSRVVKSVSEADSSSSSYMAAGVGVNGQVADSLPPDTSHVGNLSLLGEEVTAPF